MLMPPSLSLSPLLLTLALSAPAGAWGQPPGRPPVADETSAIPVLRRPAPAATDLDRALAGRDYERAALLLAEAIARQPASRPLLLQIASVFMLDRKPLNAAVALKKAEALGPLDSRERLQLVMAYIAMRRDDWARPELERLVQDEPANVIHPYWLARLDYNAGQYATAIARLQEVVTRKPAFARAHDNLGLCYEALNQPDQAILHYKEAVRLTRLDDPPSAWPALNLAVLLRTRGDLAEAEGLLHEALRHDPDLPQAHYQLGALLEQSGRLDAAVLSLRRATAADPTYAEPYYVLSRIARRQGHTAEADAALQTFQRLRVPQPGQRTPPP